MRSAVYWIRPVAMSEPRISKVKMDDSKHVIKDMIRVIDFTAYEALFRQAEALASVLREWPAGDTVLLWDEFKKSAGMKPTPVPEGPVRASDG